MSSRMPVLLLAALALAASACIGSAGTQPESTADRVAAVQSARAQVAGPAQQLGTAAAEVDAQVDELRAAPGRAADVEALEEAVAELSDATADLEEVDLDATTSDVRDAAEVVDRLVDAADRLAEAGGDLAEVAERLAAVNARLEQLRTSWDQPGSRSQVLASLDEAAAAADDLGVEVSEACPGPAQERNAAAEFVARASRDLESLVSSHDGEGYDERRAELAEAPYGRTDDDEVRRLDAPIDPDGCPALDRATTAADDVSEALEALEDVLNPADLAS